LPSEIADELINSDCSPPQKRYSLIRYMKYTIRRDTIEARSRLGRPRTPEFISLVQNNMENKRRRPIHTTNALLKRKKN
jgi:hypothetical protein